MRQYYTPKLLPKLLAGEKLPSLPDIAQINRVQPMVRTPVIEADPKDPDLVRVRVQVAQQSDGERASGLQDLRLFRNGQLVGLREGPLQDGEYPFDGVRLPHTKSIEFSAYTFNSALVKSDTVRTTYRRSVTPSAPQPRTFLLNIGVSRYQAAACNLKYAASDAVAMNKALASRLPRVVSKVLVSDGSEVARASKESIRAALAEIAKQATPDDVFLMSFSGHGHTDKEGRFYIFPSDLSGDCRKPDDPSLLSSAISTDEMTEWLRPLDAGEMVMILDACYSAASVESADFKPAPMGNRGLGQLAYDKRLRILAASQSTQLAGEADSLQMGLLTYALLINGLTEKGADWQPHDGVIRLREWLSYGAKRVPEIYG
jgi:hypothetical protein